MWFASFIRSARVPASMTARSASSALTFSPLMSIAGVVVSCDAKLPFPPLLTRESARLCGWEAPADDHLARVDFGFV